MASNAIASPKSKLAFSKDCNAEALNKILSFGTIRVVYYEVHITFWLTPMGLLAPCLSKQDGVARPTIDMSNTSTQRF